MRRRLWRQTDTASESGPYLFKLQSGRGLRRPGVCFVIRGNDRLFFFGEQFQKCGQIEAMPDRSERLQILYRQTEKTGSGRQPAAMLRMVRMLKLQLQMHESSRGLDQALEKVGVLGDGFEPKMLENIMRFVVPLLIPAAKIASITGVRFDSAGSCFRFLSLEFLHET